MTDPNETPIDDGDRTAGGGIIDPHVDGTLPKEEDEIKQTGLKEVVNGRLGSDVD